MKKEDILVIYGNEPKEMARKICENASLETLIGDKNKKIGLKPNLVLPHKAENGATTHSEVAEGIIEYLQSKGYFDISIIEGSCVGSDTEQAFRVCGYTKLAETYHVKNIDTRKDTWTVHNCKGVEIKICNSALSVDYMINLPVLKGHCQTKITCALKNNKGVIPDSEKRRFHTMGLHKPIAHLNTVVRNDFIIVDGICGDLNFEEGGTPVQMNRLIGAMDPVLCDAYVCGLIGYEVSDVQYIKIAEEMGIGSADMTKANVMETDQNKKHIDNIKPTNRIQALVKDIKSKDACSACYGSLIYALERMKEKGISVKYTPICIGQEYRGKSGEVGIGNCTRGFQKSLGGCPPKAIDIMEFLSK